MILSSDGTRISSHISGAGAAFPATVLHSHLTWNSPPTVATVYHSHFSNTGSFFSHYFELSSVCNNFASYAIKLQHIKVVIIDMWTSGFFPQIRHWMFGRKVSMWILHGSVLRFIYHQCFVCFGHLCGLSVNRVLWLWLILLPTSEHSSFSGNCEAAVRCVH